MASTDQLQLMAAKNVVVHPLVLLSIQDHAARVAKGTKKRVVGILLGQDLGPQGINVANSFAGGFCVRVEWGEELQLTLCYPTVPFEEDDKDPRTWFLDHNYIESMNDMFKKVNGESRRCGRSKRPSTDPLCYIAAREKLIGWYHTGPKLRASDLEVNEVIKRYTPKPVMVIVDIRPDGERVGGGIPTDAYFAVEEIKDVSLGFVGAEGESKS
jgi:26S proteasome regulatory subunit N8